MKKIAFTISFIVIFISSTLLWAQTDIVNTHSPKDDLDAMHTHPNQAPYRTTKNLVEHFSSILPSLWRLAWYAPGLGTIWVEQYKIDKKIINFFFNDERTGGFFPLGVNTRESKPNAGITAFHSNLFDKHRRVYATYGRSSKDKNIADLAYFHPKLLNSFIDFDFRGEIFHDPTENLFINEDIAPQEIQESSINGNNTNKDDKVTYESEERKLRIQCSHTLQKHIQVGVFSRFKRTYAELNENVDEPVIENSLPGLESSRLVSIGSSITFDFKEHNIRTISGTLLRLKYDYTDQLDGNEFGFHRYGAEIQQFVPTPFLPKNRRLGLRACFEKLEEVSTRQIPFHELSMLGDSRTLRGFDQNRFRGKGYLLFNIEYRYPIWDTWDAVIFLDEGQVFDDVDDITLNDFHYGVGAGIRLMAHAGFLFSLEAAGTKEGGRIYFNVSPNF